MPQPVAFETGMEYTLQGVGYRIIATGRDGSIFARNLMTHDETGTTRAILLDAWLAGTLRFALHGNNLRQEDAQPLATSYAFTDLDFLPEAERILIWAKYQFCQPLLALPRRHRTHAVVQARIDEVLRVQADEQPEAWMLTLRTYAHHTAPKGTDPTQGASARRPTLALRTVYRWLQALTVAHGDPRALRHGRERQGRKAHLHPEAQTAFQDALTDVYKQRQQPTIQTAYDEMCSRIATKNTTRTAETHIPMPSRSTMYRIVERLDQEDIDIARLGVAHTERKYAGINGGPEPTRPNERWEEDHTKLDYLVIDPDDGLPIGRPLFTALRDRYSYYPPGVRISFEPPNVRAVLECLGFGMLPKTHLKAQFGLQHDYLAWGVPELLAIDNGPEFRSTDVELACYQLGITVHRMPRRTPWFKGGIEKFIGDMQADLIHTMPGTTFSNFLARDDYDPSRYACISLDRLWELCIQWIVDVYTQDAHRGRVKGVPARLWERALVDRFTPHLPVNREELLTLLTRIETRCIVGTGIWFDDICYFSLPLMGLRARLDQQPGRGTRDAKRLVDIAVSFKYNPGDLARIWVMDPLTKRYLEVPAARQFQEYTRQLTQWKHRVIKRYAREELRQDIDLEALLEAKHRIHVKITDEFRRKKQVKSRMGAARWFDLQVTGWLQPPPAGTAPLVQELSLAQATPPAFGDALVPTVASPEVVGIAALATNGSMLPEMVAGVTLLANVAAPVLEVLPAAEPEATPTPKPKKRGKPGTDAAMAPVESAAPVPLSPPARPTTMTVSYTLPRRKV
ncbi:MAG: DDE-type integrase/transposase/recombinase [Ktedonobacterales bacterium]|nr:DDE-type integrase/transposase/recombinase [Ktedonobacterales bacterium]